MIKGGVMAEVTRVIDIHRDFREHSIAEFFKKNRQMLGYSGKIKSLTTAVHEYVTNALDACEEAKITPDIYVKLEKMGPDHYKLIVEDNGPGMKKNLVGKAFGTMLSGTKFHRFQQARGQQGIGAAGVVMFSQITTGKPTKVVTSNGSGNIYDCYVSIDAKTNTPKIDDPKEYTGQMQGLRIESELKNVKYQKGEYSPDEYIRRTALANPHVKITYIDPDNLTTVYDRAVGKIPKHPKVSKPHPKGVDVDDLLGYAGKTKSRTIKSFLVNDFTRMSSAKAKEIQNKVSFDLNKRPQDMRWEEAEEIVKTINNTNFIAPPTDCLIPIGEENLNKAMTNVIKPEFKTVLTRPPAIYRGGVPFVVEVALAYGGDAGKTNSSSEDKKEIMRFSNRVPLLFDTGSCAITKSVQNVDWKRYGIKEDIPVTILVNFTSIYVPYSGAGKESIIDDRDIVKEIRLALMDSGRKLGLYVSGQRRMYEREKRLKTFMRYVEPVSEALHGLTNMDMKKIQRELSILIENKFNVGEIEEGEPEKVEEAPQEPKEGEEE